MKTKLFFKAIIALLIITSIFSTENASAQGVKVIVIDPGHGGKFPGAQYKGVTEKELNLAVALKLGNIIKKSHPEIKVIYTRTTDKHLSTSLSADLGARSKIANEAQGDLFISIHANAASNTAAYGAETIIMGESSIEKQRNDAALYTANKEHLIDMSDEKTAAIVRAYIQNLQFTYGQYSEALARLIQKSYEANGRKVRPLRRQPIMVLYGTDMPCVLTEMGFMSNPTELAMMKSEKGQQQIANSIYSGIKAYIEMVNRTYSTTASAAGAAVAGGSVGGSTGTTGTTGTTGAATGATGATKNTSAATPKPPKSKSNEALKSGYTIQILSSTKALAKNDRQFKSYAGRQWLLTSRGKYKYKYCIGKYSSKEDARIDLAQVKRTFKDAYITEFKIK
ncbi:MAG: N-acetylmuramoyl-L-alanine amidase [Rikenellaceae bacterium]